MGKYYFFIKSNISTSTHLKGYRGVLSQKNIYTNIKIFLFVRIYQVLFV